MPQKCFKKSDSKTNEVNADLIDNKIANIQNIKKTVQFRKVANEHDKEIKKYLKIIIIIYIYIYIYTCKRDRKLLMIKY